MSEASQKRPCDIFSHCGRDGPLFCEDGGCDSGAGRFPVAISVPTLAFCPLTVTVTGDQEQQAGSGEDFLLSPVKLSLAAAS